MIWTRDADINRLGSRSAGYSATSGPPEIGRKSHVGAATAFQFDAGVSFCNVPAASVRRRSRIGAPMRFHDWRTRFGADWRSSRDRQPPTDE